MDFPNAVTNWKSTIPDCLSVKSLIFWNSIFGFYLDCYITFTCSEQEYYIFLLSINSTWKL